MTTLEALVWVLNSAKLLSSTVNPSGRPRDDLDVAIDIVEDFIVNNADKIRDYDLKDHLSTDEKELIQKLKELLK